ncbi:MAG: DUF1402 family protein [Bdellovibrionales bacterium]|nr:DUF1402 family protein [Bdellovibrionales bacterium]
MALVAVGCSRLDLVRSTRESVLPGSELITFESYKNREITILVTPGNRNPDVSWSTLYSNFPSRAKDKFKSYANDPVGLRKELDDRYRKTLRSIAKDQETLLELHKAAKLYQIDPVLILGNVVAEHVFNVDITDSIQTYIATSLGWAAKWALKFKSTDVLLTDLVREAPFAKCDQLKRTAHSDYWDCVSLVWETTYRGRQVNGRQHVANGLRMAFFDPRGIGMTYGLGQLDPLRALMVTDRVNRVSGLRMVSVESPEEIYQDIIDPRTAVHYVAANIVLSVEIYIRHANFDISHNPGVVSTLYNLGREKEFAASRYRENIKLMEAGFPVSLPQESYYGFFINEKEMHLREFLRTGSY